MSAPNPMPSIEILNETFLCDTETGILSWKKRGMGRRKKVGFICNTTGYAKTRVGGRYYPIHRIVWKMVTGHEPAAEIDHINGVKHDNRFRNLREATRFENNRNRPREKRNSTGFKGVTQNTANSYVAQIGFCGRRIYIGSFPTPVLAHNAYWVKAQELQGEFARRQ